MYPTPCIPDESVYTVAEFNQLKKEMLTGDNVGVREIQHADKRTVFRSATEIQNLLAIMAEAIWGHCENYQNGAGRRRYVISSKGIC